MHIIPTFIHFFSEFVNSPNYILNGHFIVFMVVTQVIRFMMKSKAQIKVKTKTVYILKHRI